GFGPSPNCVTSSMVSSAVAHTCADGLDENSVELTANVPLRHCNACGFEFLDDAAEDAQHEAICEHLQVMTPAQIRSLRQLHNMTAAEFADLTRLGVASILRWENGRSIQNAAYDDYLYFLGFDAHIARLRRRRWDPGPPG